jgi:hypothetical protein
MKRSTKSYSENKITEILASTGFIFPRNILELKNFEILFENDNFGLTGQEIDPDIILSKSRGSVRTLKLSEARYYMTDPLKLVAKKEEDSLDVGIKNLINQSNKKQNSDGD